MSIQGFLGKKNRLMPKHQPKSSSLHSHSFLLFYIAKSYTIPPEVFSFAALIEYIAKPMTSLTTAPIKVINGVKSGDIPSSAAKVNDLTVTYPVKISMAVQLINKNAINNFEVAVLATSPLYFLRSSCLSLILTYFASRICFCCSHFSAIFYAASFILFFSSKFNPLFLFLFNNNLITIYVYSIQFRWMSV